MQRTLRKFPQFLSQVRLYRVNTRVRYCKTFQVRFYDIRDFAFASYMSVDEDGGLLCVHSLETTVSFSDPHSLALQHFRHVQMRRKRTSGIWNRVAAIAFL
jgi:tRNA G37 N-methylase TrmD